MNLYVMRHGKTNWNEKGITQGKRKVRLNKSGAEQVRKVASDHKSCNFDVIICSPLVRTMQTARIMNEYHNVKIIKDEALTEIGQGIFEGRGKKGLTDEEKTLKKVRSKEAGMETFEECYNRMGVFLSGIKEKYNYQNVLLITHNVCASFIDDILLKKKKDFGSKEFSHHFDNAEIKQFVI